MLLIKKA